MAIKFLVALETDMSRLSIDKGPPKLLAGLTIGVPLYEATNIVDGTRRAAVQADFTAAQLSALTPLLSSVGLPPSKVQVLDTLPVDWRWNDV